MSAKKTGTARTSFKKEDCDTVNMDDAIERERVRRRRVEIDNKKIDVLKSAEKSIASFLSDMDSIRRKGGDFISQSGLDSLLQVPLSELDTKMKSIRAKREKIEQDLRNFAKPVVDLACFDGKKRRK